MADTQHDAERRRVVLSRRYPGIVSDIMASPAGVLALSGESWQDAYLTHLARRIGADIPMVPREMLSLMSGPGAGDESNVDAIAVACCAVPPEWIPKGPSNALVEIVESLRSALGSHVDGRLGKLLSECGGDWDGWRRKLIAEIPASAVDPDDLEDMDEEDEDLPLKPSLYDGLQAAYRTSLGFANQVVIPLLVEESSMSYETALRSGYGIALDMLLDGSTLEDFLALGKAADAEPGTFEAEVYNLIDKSEVPSLTALTGPVPAVDMVFEPLIRAHEVVAEQKGDHAGRGLRNSVAVFLPKAVAGQAHVYSVRRQTPVPERVGSMVLEFALGTIGAARFRLDRLHPTEATIRTPWPGLVLEVALLGRTGKTTADALLGSSAGTLPDDALSAFSRFAVGVAEGRTELLAQPSDRMLMAGQRWLAAEQDRGAVRLREDLHPPLRDTVDGLAGYPVGATDAIEYAYRAWKPHLPPALKDVPFHRVADVVKTVADAEKMPGLR